MRARDLTLGQIRALCKQCNCWECSFGHTVPTNKSRPRLCMIGRPRNWEVWFDDRRMSLRSASEFCRIRRQRGPDADFPCDGERCRKCSAWDIPFLMNGIGWSPLPEAWEKLLQDEKRMMESLLEVKPCD